MDTEKAREVLEWWVQNAPKAQSRGYTWGDRTSPAMEPLRAREDQTRRVIASVLGLSKLPEITTAFASGSVDLQTGIESAKYALGRLETDAETRAMLGSTAPTMSADALHATIWGAASKLWDDGHHGQAVQRAATFLNADIQDKTGRRDVSDVALMQEVFSLSAPANDKPRLRWPGKDDDLTVKAMRVGILNFAQGIYSGIRNPATHSVDDLPRQEALEQLAALSVLARWIDGCSVVRFIPAKIEKS